jgi:Glycosyl hydrolase family 65, N-terminal domain/Glycosyl hydrolase family 65, C-terminal domain
MQRPRCPGRPDDRGNRGRRRLLVWRAADYLRIMLKRRITLDDEPLFLPTARMQDYARILDMRAGTLTRELVWATDAGKHVLVRSRRIVSLEHRHLVAMTYEITMLDERAPVVVSSLVFNRQDARQADDLPEYRPGDPRLATVLPQRVLNVRAATADCPSSPGCRAWNELAFALRFCGRQLRVKLTHDEERYLVEEGEPLKRAHQGRVTPAQPRYPDRDQAPAAVTRTLRAAEPHRPGPDFGRV